MPFLKINHSVWSFLFRFPCSPCLEGRKKKVKKKSQPQEGTSLEQINFWTKEFNLLKVASIESKAWAMRSARRGCQPFWLCLLPIQLLQLHVVKQTVSGTSWGSKLLCCLCCGPQRTGPCWRYSGISVNSLLYPSSLLLYQTLKAKQKILVVRCK